MIIVVRWQGRRFGRAHYVHTRSKVENYILRLYDYVWIFWQLTLTQIISLNWTSNIMTFFEVGGINLTKNLWRKISKTCTTIMNCFLIGEIKLTNLQPINRNLPKILFLNGYPRKIFDLLVSNRSSKRDKTFISIYLCQDL